jgi:hypothetical protein
MRKVVEHCVVHHRQPPKFQSKICDVIVSDSTLRRIGALVDLTGKNQGISYWLDPRRLAGEGTRIRIKQIVSRQVLMRGAIARRFTQ